MNSKVLTISVAAYNAAETLRECLDSCIAETVMESIEVIVVDDGSTDNTVQIADEYIKKWPDTFRVISKANGGYGSTINTSLPIARGKYFKLLDADDWLDQDALENLVSVLADTNVDLVYTERVKESPSGPIYDDTSRRKPLIDLGVISAPEDLALLKPMMWVFTVRKALYEEHPFELPEHCLYTDGLFVANFAPHIRTALYLPKILYHYRYSYSDGQSMSRISERDHLRDFELVWSGTRDIAKRYGAESGSMVEYRASIDFLNLHRSLMLQPGSSSARRRVQEADRRLANELPSVYDRTSRSSRTIRLLRKSHYLLYWPIKLVRYRI